MYTPEDKLKKLKTFAQNPDLAKYNELQGIVESLDEIKQSMPPAFVGVLKGDKGDKGDTGDQGPEGPAGQDSTVPGPKGDKGDPGKPGKDGKDGKDGLDGRDGIDGKDGKDGVNGSPDTGFDIVDKINALDTNPENQIDASHIKNLPKAAKGGGGVMGILNITSGNHNIVIDDDPVLANTKRITFTPDIVVSLTAPSNPKVNDLWYDLN